MEPFLKMGVGVRWGLEIALFCIVILAALVLDTGLDEFSSELSDCPSIDKMRGKTQTMLNWPNLWHAA